MMTRILTLAIFLTLSAHAATTTKVDPKAIRLIDPATQAMYNFHEVKRIHVHPVDGQSYDAAYDQVKKLVDGLKKDSAQVAMKGNPASSFCTERLKGKSETFKDLMQNEYTICRMPDGLLVDAWDLFRLKK